MTTKNLRFEQIALLLLIFFCAGIQRAGAQTTLVAGEIAFTGYNAVVTTSDFSFVLLKAVSAGTSINFTDNGWNSTLSTPALGTAEGTILWSTAAGLPQYTEVTIKVNNAGTAISSVSAGSGSISGTFLLSGSGDQILAYQGAAASPTFISGIHMNSENVANGPSNVSSLSGWDDLNAGGWPYTTGRSAIPPGLTNGVNAIMVVSGASAPYTESDDALYNCTGSSSSANVAALAAAINNRANWSMANSTPYPLPSGCTFVATGAPVVNTPPSNSSICVGGTTTFTVSATNAVSYQWQENSGSGFANIIDGGIYSNATTSTLTLTGVTAGMNGNAYRVVVTGSSSVNSASATLTVTSPGTWLGGTSAAWSNTANWSCGVVPTAVTNVTITSGTTFSPQINITTAVVNNLTIASGATLSFTGSGNVLDIKGAVTNNGTFNASGGQTVFSGGAQTIPALTYQSLQMNGAGNKTLAGAITVTGTLTMTSGFILLGSNNLTIGPAGSVAGSSVNSFIVINSTGGLIQQNIGATGRTGSITFPIGTSTTSYTPAAINNIGTADNFTARIINNVYADYDASGNPTTAALTTNAVAKTWLLSEAVAGGSNATVTLVWNGVNELSLFNRNNSFISHYVNGGWLSASAPGPAAGIDPYSLSFSGVQTFSPFGVGSGATPLPLDLLSFTGRRENDNVVLNWTTTNEVNIAGFGIERSSDGIRFAEIDRIAARNEPTLSNNYKFTDRKVAGAKLYYRLRMDELDGTYKYSEIVNISLGADGDVRYSVYPNPVTGSGAYIKSTNLSAGSLDMSIIDITGKQWYENSMDVSKIENNTIPIDLKQVPAGMYILQLKNNNIVQHINIVRQ